MARGRIDKLKTNKYMSYIRTKGRNTIRYLEENKKSITYVVADRGYCFIYFESGEFMHYARPIKKLEPIFPEFVRPNKRYLINPAFFTELPNFCYTYNSIQIKTSRRKRK